MNHDDSSGRLAYQRDGPRETEQDPPRKARIRCNSSCNERPNDGERSTLEGATSVVIYLDVSGSGCLERLQTELRRQLSG